VLETVFKTACETLWLDQMKALDHGSGTAAYWDRRSRAFHSKCQSSTYADELLSRMDLALEYSVMDVGCGCGAVAIPLARRCNRVTALDISSIRLDKLRRKSGAEGLKNITAVNLDWNCVTLGRELNKHDIVLLSRNTPIGLSNTLGKIYLAARLAFYITWRAERTDEFESEVAEAMERQTPIFPDFSIIFMMLKQMGITVITEIFEEHTQERFDSLNEAALNMARGYELTPKKYDRLLEIAKNRLTESEQCYQFDRRIKWVLISGAGSNSTGNTPSSRPGI
jgi:hypothetical protein